MQKIFETYCNLIESSYRNEISHLENLSPTKKLWDLIVITAISHDQKRCYEKQLQMKLENKKLPKTFQFKVLNDPDNCKIGSGGSTLNVINQLHKEYKEQLFSMKILLIHAGGYSQRMPNCTVLGKIFGSIASQSEYINDFLDIKLATYTPFSVEMKPGIFLASSDDIITCDLEEQLEASKLFGSNNDFILLAHKSSLIVGKDHGVYAVDGPSKNGRFNVFDCKFVLQKPSIDKMRQLNVCLDDNNVLSDSLFYFSSNITRLLLEFHDLYFDKICQFKIEIDSYRDFLQPLGTHPLSIEQYLKALNINNDQLKLELFQKLYSILINRSSLIINLNNSIFYHLGTVNELLDFYLNVDSLDAVEFRKNICFSRLKLRNKNLDFNNLKGCVQNSIINSSCNISPLSLIEYSVVDPDIQLVLNDYAFLNNCLIKKSDLNIINVPANVCMHTIAIKVDTQIKYVTTFFNKNDDLKKAFNDFKQLIFLGKTLPGKLAEAIQSTNENQSIWNLKIFQAFDSMSEAFLKSLSFIQSYLDNNSEDFCLNGEQYYSLFDLLKLQNYEKMLNFRYENGLL